MHFKCEKQALQSIIQRVNRVVGSSANMPILSHICITAKNDQLELIATDLNKGMICKLPVNVIESGSVACPASSLVKIICALPNDELEFELNARDMLVIKTKNSRYEMPTLPSNEFPSTKNPEPLCFFNINGKDLAYMINAVKFAAANSSNTRTHMQSVYFDLKDGNLILVSTDGRRMARIIHNLGDQIVDNRGVIVPTSSINEFLIDANESYRVEICEKQIYFSNSNTRFHCSFIDANYPDYTRFFVQENVEKKRCIVDRAILLDALIRVMVMAQDKANMGLVEFSFDTDVVSLSSNTINLGSGSESIPAILESQPVKISFNGNYIVEVLKALKCETIEIDLKNVNAGVVIRPLESQNYDYICMPMRR